jgi:hypothetical protein
MLPWKGSTQTVTTSTGGGPTGEAMGRTRSLDTPAGPPARSREEGVTLMEVVLSATLLLVVLVPSTVLLQTSSSLLSVNKAKVVAANLASGQLEADRAAADGAPWTGTPAVPDLPTPVSPVQVPTGGGSYTVSQVAGWCAESTNGAGTTWTTYTGLPAGNPPAYTVTVTVGWPVGSHDVSAAETLTTPPGVSAPDNSGSTSCPS